MKALIESIDQFLAEQLHGWCTPEKAHNLAALVVALRPETTVEIGVYAGRSTISMAMAHNFIGKGSVIGIDPYTKEAALEGQCGDHQKWWSEFKDMDWVLNLFIEQVQKRNLGSYVTLIRSKSDDVTPPDTIDLFHCDGNHSDQAVRDVERFASHVRVGGITIMDDINWPGGGVSRAVQKLKELGFIELYPLDGGAVFQRTVYASTSDQA